MPRSFSVILASTHDGGIGIHGKLPWNISHDLQKFKSLTTDAADGKQNAIIMGRHTFRSLGRVLPSRLHVVLSTSKPPKLMPPSTVWFPHGLDAAVDYCDSREDIDKIFVIGGAEVFNEALSSPRCGDVYWTHVIVRAIFFDMDRYIVPIMSVRPWKTVTKSEWFTQHQNNVTIDWRFIHLRPHGVTPPPTPPH
jgi:dihydrofolate reductase